MPSLTIDIEPRPQFVPFLQRNERWASIVAHRRAGKTVACIQDLIKEAVTCEKHEPRMAYIGPTYTQTKDVAWSYIKQYTSSIPGITISESELSVTFEHNSARIRLYGAENYERLRGLYLDAAVIDESGDIDPRAWTEVLRPALSDRLGTCTFIGTPKGRNWFYKLHSKAKEDPDWYTAELRADDTGLIDEKELADAERMMAPEQFAAEYLCSFEGSLRGAYYAKDVLQAEHEERIRNVPHDKAVDVFAAFDLGIGDSTAIWVFQVVGQEYHFLHFYENNGESLDHYVDWLRDLPYRVDHLILPHDAEARELQTGKSRLEFLMDRGLDCNVVPLHKIDDGIAAVRLRFNRMYFDKVNAGAGVELLRMYRSEYDAKRDVLKRNPIHDFSSHCADAMRYAIMGIDEHHTVDLYEGDDDGGWIV